MTEHMTNCGAAGYGMCMNCRGTVGYIPGKKQCPYRAYGCGRSSEYGATGETIVVDAKKNMTTKCTNPDCKKPDRGGCCGICAQNALDEISTKIDHLTLSRLSLEELKQLLIAVGDEIFLRGRGKTQEEIIIGRQ